ncbi:hypothetical protein GOP56_07705 [Brevibacillus sp. 7WMA2]|uniref:hypothetical protein n=1 Tax=Brevibacillus sp. 7WMA2 TaxID=2683193 RepID=UPI0013A76A23|nr:hypothetical protein GOP56_07705 [Brevibacillus sp. 7WMA2]
MPSKPLKTCLHSRCPTLTRVTYCPLHQQYDRERGSSTQRGYDAKWGKARIGFLRKHIHSANIALIKAYSLVLQ